MKPQLRIRLVTFMSLLMVLGATLGVIGRRIYQTRSLSIAVDHMSDQGGEVIWATPGQIVDVRTPANLEWIRKGGDPSLLVWPYPVYGIEGESSLSPSLLDRFSLEPVWFQFYNVTINRNTFGSYTSQSPIAMDFNECRISQEGLEAFPSNVKWIEILDCEIPIGLFQKLSIMEELEYCRINFEPQVSPEGISELERSTSISTLVLINARLSENDISSLFRMPKLRKLYLIYCDIFENVDWSRALENSKVQTLSTVRSGVSELERQSVQKPGFEWSS